MLFFRDDCGRGEPIFGNSMRIPADEQHEDVQVSSQHPTTPRLRFRSRGHYLSVPARHDKTNSAFLDNPRVFQRIPAEVCSTEIPP